MSTQFLFFSGKGGVGKTSMACTHAVRYADEGQRTLIVTTDPASNLADVFEQPIGHQVTPIAGVPNLRAMEIDPDQATQEYIDHAMAPIRAAFPPPMIQVMEKQMSGPCTAEVASFDRFTDFLDVPTADGKAFDVVIFDTAPTGHTLRLLELPAEWSQSIDDASHGRGQACIGLAAAIQDAKHKYERAMAIMRDPAVTTFFFVLHPEAVAIKETRRAVAELSKLGIANHQLIVNSVIPPEARTNPLFAARAEMQTRYLAQITQELPAPTRTMTLLPGEIQGVKRLRAVGATFFDGAKTAGFGQNGASPRTITALPSLHGVAERVSPNGHSRAVFFAGKGGVGKTVASCITAAWLARQGHKTLLLTTDPAAHLGDVLGLPVGDTAEPVACAPNLWAAKIDPKAAAYKTRILDDPAAAAGQKHAIQTMEEELDSPCTEEMAAFDLFIDFASQAQWDSIVFDTAPTGHTLRLLELPLDWSKQIDVKVFASVDTAAADDVAKQRFGQVINMMRDPAQSTFAFVMYPESTPILEADRAAKELRTVGIEPGLVVANFIIPAEVATTPFATARRAMQSKYMGEIARRFPVPLLQIPLLPAEIKGLRTLASLGDQIYGNGVHTPTPTQNHKEISHA